MHARMAQIQVDSAAISASWPFCETAAAAEKDRAKLLELQKQGRSVPSGVLDPLLAVLIQVPYGLDQ